LIGNQLHEEIQIELLSLTKHTVILAGSGSGKTVLIKRLIEEAALAGIPAIVIDAANDLARLGHPGHRNLLIGKRTMCKSGTIFPDY
jgi:DNA helicase HerA-like ATPase